MLSSLSSSSVVALQLAGYYTPGSTYYIVPLINTSLCLSVPLSADGAVQGVLVTLQLRLCHASASYQRFTFLPSGLINVADGVVNASLQAYGGCIVNSVLRQYPGDSGSGNELWAYSTDSQQLSVCSTLCLTVNASSAVANSVQLMQLCSQRSALQQWLFGHFSSVPSPPFNGSTGAAWASTTSSSSSSVPTALAPSEASDIDVITIKGQSNAQGRGYYLNATLDTYSGGALYQYVIGDEFSCNDDPGVSTCTSVKGLAGLVLPLQQEPLLDAWPTTNSPYDVQIGFALRWGRTYLADHPGRTLIIVQAAVGGTGFSNGFWAAPSEVLYLRARNATNAVMRMFPNARNLGWLWCQGEADSSMVQSAYQSYLSQLISTDRATTVGANTSTPFAILSITPYTAPVATAQIQLALKAMPSLVAYTSWTLGPGNSSNSSYSDINVTADSQHYDAAAQRINGVNLYQGWLQAASAPLPRVQLQTDTTFITSTYYYLVSAVDHTLCLTVPLSAADQYQSGLVPAALLPCAPYAANQQLAFNGVGELLVQSSGQFLQLSGSPCTADMIAQQNSISRPRPANNSIFAYIAASGQLAVCGFCLTINATSTQYPAVGSGIVALSCRNASLLPLQQFLFGVYNISAVQAAGAAASQLLSSSSSSSSSPSQLSSPSSSSARTGTAISSPAFQSSSASSAISSARSSSMSSWPLSSSGQPGALPAGASLQVNRSYSIVSAGNTSLCVSVPLSAGGAAPTGVTALSMAACNASASSQRWLYLSNQRLQSLDGVAQDYMQAYGGCGLNNSVVAYVRSSAPGTNEQWSYNSSAAALTLSICARQYCLCISAASNAGSGQPAGGQSLIVAGCSTHPPLHSQWLFAPVNSSDTQTLPLGSRR